MAVLSNGKQPISFTHPTLANEWDYIKNYPFTPDDVTAGSNKLFWWLCPKKHSYDAKPNSRKNGSGCPYCAGKRTLSGFNDLATLNLELAKEWDYKKNAPLTPSDFTVNSQKKVWWRCYKGHSWEAMVANRNKGANCPYCTNARVLVGFNDLATLNPILASEWNYEKNAGLKDQRDVDVSSPEKVTEKSGLNVWWKCSQGHEWQARICERSRNGLGCPFCSNKRVLVGINDLATTNPDIASEWDYEKNAGLKNKQDRDISTPDRVTAGSHQKVWWKCSRGHEDQAVIQSRMKSGCPYGSKCIEPKHFQINERLLNEWDFENNKNLNPLDLIKGFDGAVWWKCPNGHCFKATIKSRNLGKICPVCKKEKKQIAKEEKAIDLACVSPELFSEWDKEKNGDLDPHKLLSVTLIKAWWKCKFGHSWQALVTNRIRGTGCPYCKSTGSSMPEQGIAFYLSKICCIEQRAKVNNREIDIYLPEYKVGVEYDGLYFHADESKKKQDKEKDLAAIKGGIYLIRIKESDANELIGEDIIMFKTDNMGTNYEWALQQVCRLLSVLTENDDFLKIDVDVRRDRLQIRERFNLSIKENSLSAKYPELAKEWNFEKNGVLLPDMFSYGAQEKVWWKCPNGHDYQAVIGSRTNMKSGCPYCAGKALLSGFNDLLSVNPLLAKEWDYGKNKGLTNQRGIDISTPDKVTAYAKESVWWKCNKGHSWRTSISVRSRGNGCPICSHQRALKGETDLATTNPELAKEWNYEKNKPLTPFDVTKMSGQRVWWKCEQGHEWQANINNRCRGNKCPVCCNVTILKGVNDLLSINPDLANEWNYEKNSGLKDKRNRDVSTPDKVSANSSIRVWWKCSKCGNEWQSSIANRNGGCGCTNCYHSSKRKQVMNIDTNIKYQSCKEASEDTGINIYSIGDCCRGKQKTAGGFHWKYVDN